MILTPDQRLRVFVSSTLGELAAERTAVREAIESLRLAPVMFEMGARPHPPRALYRAYLEQSHVFVAIYAERYGWVAPTMAISGLEDEYRLSGDRPKLVYVLSPAPGRDPQLTALLEDVASDPRVRMHTYAAADDLAAAVAADLASMLAERFAASGSRVVAADTAATTRALPTPGDTGDLPPLPVAATSLIGRERELEELANLLRRSDVRLVTVTGMGGIGKSRLALEVAHRMHEHFTGGVVIVPLGEVPEPGLVVTSIASHLGIRLDTATPSVDAVADAVGERGELLVLLDNAEQVRDAADDLAALVATCPNLTLLVTSRSRIRLVAEHDYPLAPLSAGPPVPYEGYRSADRDPDEVERAAERSDAVRLFLERAHAARPDLDLASDPAQVRAVVRLCRRLDGLPLLIELAAARVRLLPPTMLLDRLHRAMDLPAARLADLPPRQRTLRGTLDWSHDLLGPAERDLLAQLSTFVGGASLAAIEQVVSIDGDVLESLATLADHSLLELDLTVPDPPRFTMLETVRDYARERLHASGRTREVDLAHRAWVRELARQAHAALPTAAHQEWLERLELEAGNIRVAGSRANADGEPHLLAEVGFDLWLWLWARHHTREARLWLERALEHAEQLDALTRARLLWALSGAAVEQGDNEVAVARLAGARQGFEEVGDAEGLALCGFLSASLAPLSGEHDRAVAEFAATEQALLALGDRFVASICSGTAGMLLAQTGRFDEAERCLDRSLAQAEAIDSAMLRGVALVARGFARLGQGALDVAAVDLGDGARWSFECRNPETLSFACDGLAAVLLARDSDLAQGAVLVGAAQGLRDRVGIVPWPGMRPVMAAIADGVRSGLGDDAFEAARHRGRRLSVDDVVALTRRVVDELTGRADGAVDGGPTDVREVVLPRQGDASAAVGAGTDRGTDRRPSARIGTDVSGA